MALSDEIISASVLICENILQEADGVLSAIRIVDLFRITRNPEVPLDKQSVPMRLLIQTNFRSSVMVGAHHIRLDLTRPDGTITPGPQEVEVIVSPPLVPTAYQGMAVGIQAGVIPKQDGAHHWTVFFDGEELGKAPFTLLDMKQGPVSQ